MARYLIAVCISILAVLAACSTGYPSAEDARTLKDAAVAYPEVRSERVHVLELHAAPAQATPRSTHHYLPAFTHHIKADANVASRLRDIDVLYRAPNRSPDLDTSFVPIYIPDRIEIARHGRLLVNQPIPGGFTGSLSYRALEVAKLRTGGADYVLVIANGFVANPLWLSIFAANGDTVYRVALPHGAYRFVENADGISFVDDAGRGRRVILFEGST